MRHAERPEQSRARRPRRRARRSPPGVLGSAASGSHRVRPAPPSPVPAAPLAPEAGSPRCRTIRSTTTDGPEQAHQRKSGSGVHVLLQRDEAELAGRPGLLACRQPAISTAGCDSAPARGGRASAVAPPPRRTRPAAGRRGNTEAASRSRCRQRGTIGDGEDAGMVNVRVQADEPRLRGGRPGSVGGTARSPWPRNTPPGPHRARTHARPRYRSGKRAEKYGEMRWTEAMTMLADSRGFVRPRERATSTRWYRPRGCRTPPPSGVPRAPLSSSAVQTTRPILAGSTPGGTIAPPMAPSMANIDVAPATPSARVIAATAETPGREQKEFMEGLEHGSNAPPTPALSAALVDAGCRRTP